MHGVVRGSHASAFVVLVSVAVDVSRKFKCFYWSVVVFRIWSTPLDREIAEGNPHLKCLESHQSSSLL